MIAFLIAYAVLIGMFYIVPALAMCFEPNVTVEPQKPVIDESLFNEQDQKDLEEIRF